MNDAVDAAMARVDRVDQRAKRVAIGDVADEVLDAGAARAQALEVLAHLAGGEDPPAVLLDERRLQLHLLGTPQTADELIYASCDVLEILTRALDTLGVQ